MYKNEAFNLGRATLVNKVLRAKDEIAFALAMSGKIMHYFQSKDAIIDVGEINGAEENPHLIEGYYRELYNELNAADVGYTKKGMYSKGFNLMKEDGEKLLAGIIVPGDDDRHAVLIKKFSKTSFALVYDSGYYLMACKDEEEFVFVFALLQTFIERNFDVEF
jgi:hypothetical protein